MGYSSPVSGSSGGESEDEKPPRALHNSTYNSWKSSLRGRMKDIKAVGDIAAFSLYPSFTNPGLKIEGHPTIPLPLTTADAEVIKGACREAPFGKGDDTVVDTSVRKTWELSHTEFQLLNREWPGFLQKISLAAARGLGLSDISVKPHKLLLYEKGSFFKRHKDSEKEKGMVGTLVVCLPSEHEGGDVHLTFGSDHRVFSTAPTSTFDLTTLAWFSDVTHEVKELTSGYRLALTYNIIQNSPIKQSAGFFGQQAQQVRQLLLEWHTRFPTTNMLVYPLSHKYSQASLELQNMKGRDKALCQAVHDVGSRSGVFLLFAHLTRTTGDGEEDIYGRYGAEEEEETTLLDSVYTLDGKLVASAVSVDDEEMLVPDLYKDRSPDSSEEGEFVGNESAPSSYRYHDSVLVLVKKQSLYKYLKGDRYWAGYDARTDNMVNMVAKDLEKNIDHAPTKTSALAFLKAALNVDGRSLTKTSCTAVYWSLKLDDIGLFQAAMAAAAKFGGQEAYNEAIKITCRYVEDQFANSAGSIDWDKWLGGVTEKSTLAGLRNTIEHFAPRFTSDAVRDSFKRWGENKLTWKLETQAEIDSNELSFFAKTLESRHEDMDWIKSSLLPILATRGTRDLIYKVLNTVFVKREQREFRNAKEIFQYFLENALAKLLLEGEDMATRVVNPTVAAFIGPLIDFVNRVDEALTLGLAELAIQLLEACCNNLVWTKEQWDPRNVNARVVDQFLVPLTSIMEKHNIPVTEPIREVFETVIRDGLIAQVGSLPPPPIGWQHKPRRCAPRSRSRVCADCDALEAFLISPDMKVWRFPAAEARRRHIEHVLSSHAHNFFRLTTERPRSPYTLVVEKTGLEHTAEVAAWHRKVEDLDTLLASSLRNDTVKRILGEQQYQELVLLEVLRRQGALGNVAGVKREADGPADGQPSAHRVMR
ncbi:2OG-Fe(II) oxygenase [Colletotrichum truncatum]|uniref:2OG-Fe(II) oxygenase n=1 Tax=Colletotrichum truncatum TaxID=5467 RepID=A0ACC3Z0B2_COLTU|nr:2OG-Fe(II) oxygenase [Colletotrichum truncatum]KAF6800710.1 2OG-Fe(II) oxygenase [Colletotrichum truncatum]